MEISYYDSDGDDEKKFKQLYSYRPRDTFRMLICGNSGSGKTNLLYHMLMEPLIHYEEIYLYLEHEKYQKLMKKMREMSKHVGYNRLNVSNDKTTPVSHGKSYNHIYLYKNGTNKLPDNIYSTVFVKLPLIQ